MKGCVKIKQTFKTYIYKKLKKKNFEKSLKKSENFTCCRTRAQTAVYTSVGNSMSKMIILREVDKVNRGVEHRKMPIIRHRDIVENAQYVLVYYEKQTAKTLGPISNFS